MEAITNSILNDQGRLSTLVQSDKHDTDQTKIKKSRDKNEEASIESILSYKNNDDINKVAQAINDYLGLARRDVQVEIHRETNTPIFKVVRSKDKKVLCEIPPRELLNIAVKIRDMVGSFVDHNA